MMSGLENLFQGLPFLGGGGVSKSAASASASAVQTTGINFAPTFTWGGTLDRITPSSNAGFSAWPSSSANPSASVSGNDGTAWGGLPFGSSTPRAVRYDVDSPPSYIVPQTGAAGVPAGEGGNEWMIFAGIGLIAVFMLDR